MHNLCLIEGFQYTSNESIEDIFTYLGKIWSVENVTNHRLAIVWLVGLFVNNNNASATYHTQTYLDVVA
jgi:hypothetical protein